MAVLRSADNRGSAIALQGIVAGASISRERHLRSGRHSGQRSHRAARRGRRPDGVPGGGRARDRRQRVVVRRSRRSASTAASCTCSNTRITGNDAIACAQVAMSATGLGLAGSSMAISPQQLLDRRQRRPLRRRWRLDRGATSSSTRRLQRPTRRLRSTLATGLDKNGVEPVPGARQPDRRLRRFGHRHPRAGARADRASSTSSRTAATALSPPTTPMPARCRSRTTICATSIPRARARGDCWWALP